jgi:dUTPase
MAASPTHTVNYCLSKDVYDLQNSKGKMWSLSKDDGDAGYDLKSAVNYVIRPHSRALIPTGVRISMPSDIYAQIHPRSGLAIRGIDIGAGTIDASF